MIRIAQPKFVQGQGRRAHQEDSVHPGVGATRRDRLFIVCDGVGGSPGGDLASSIACHSLAEYIEQRNIDLLDPDLLQVALQHARVQMQRHIQQNPPHAGMATTLSLLFLNAASVTVAWIGDSRIYHLRGEEVLFRSRDHSLVQEMVDRGELRPEEAATFPFRNVITRVIGPGRADAPDIRILDDLQPGDRLALLSDGILDGLAESELLRLCAEAPSLRDLCDEIDARCRAHSSDNYSLCLLQIGEIHP
jgi:PPM family protein phosphatase